MSLSPGQVMARLQELEQEMAVAENELEAVAQTYFKAKRDWDRKLAIETVKADGRNSDERRANALIALTTDEAFYKSFIAAEATYEALKLSQRSRADRASIGQTLLRTMREL